MLFRQQNFVMFAKFGDYFILFFAFFMSKKKVVKKNKNFLFLNKTKFKILFFDKIKKMLFYFFIIFSR